MGWAESCLIEAGRPPTGYSGTSTQDHLAEGLVHLRRHTKTAKSHGARAAESRMWRGISAEKSVLRKIRSRSGNHPAVAIVALPR